MKANQTGFTLLEAMVAIVILSMSLFATYAWINISVQTLQRSSETLTEEILVNEFLQMVVISGTHETEGRLERDGQVLEWRKVSVAKKEGRNNIGSVGFHDHMLFDVEISLKKSDRLTASHVTRLVESVQVREPEEALFL